MATAAPTTQPTPARIFETLTAHQQTAALKAAIELDVFTAIGEGATSADALAQRCSASQRGVRILCDYLVVHGVLTKEGKDDGLSLDSATFLDRRSPAYIGTIVRFMALPELTDRFRDLAGVVRKGGTLKREEGLSQESSIWIEFARSMPPLIAGSADMIATLAGAEAGESWKVLDIAAG